MSNSVNAEIFYYFNNESYSFSLSDTQFDVIATILGLQLNFDGSIRCYSDESLKQVMEMDSNPFKLQKLKKD